MKKGLKYLLFSLSTMGVLAVAISAITYSSTKRGSRLFSTKATDGPYSLVLNSTNSPAGLTSEYQDNVSTTVTTSLGNTVNLNLVLAKSLSNKYCVLAHRGMIYNFASEDGRINGMTSITASISSGSVTLYTSSQELSTLNGDGAYIDTSYEVTSGFQLTLNSPAKYFALVAGDNGATITSLTINYSCSNQGIGFDTIAGSYLGWYDASPVRMVFSRSGINQVVSLTSSVGTSNGTVSLNGSRITSTFSGQTYVCDVQEKGYKLSFVSTTTSHPQVDFYRVYNVDDFEQYSIAGNGWDQNNSRYNTTGIRSCWFGDYNATTSKPSPIGGSSWSLMGSTDYLQYGETKGRNNSKVAAFKGNGGNNCRYVQSKAVYGINSVVGRGNTLSFYAQGAYSNNTLTTKSGSNSVVRAIAYYYSKIDSTNHTSYDYKEFTIPANSNWTEYKMDLDASKNYYAVGFICKTGSTYTPIDDITIYTEIIPEYPEGIFKTKISATLLGKTYNYDTIISIGSRTNQKVFIRIGEESAEATGIAYNSITKAITIHTSGDIKGYEYGDITGTYDEANNKITNIRCNGSIGSYVNNNGSLVATQPEYYYDCNGSTDELRTIFKRRFNNGSWNIDTSNSDRIVSYTTDCVSGNGAMKVRGYGDGKVGLNLLNDISTKKYNNLAAWIYNSSASDITVSIFIYKAANMTNFVNPGSYSIKAGQWTYVSCGFGGMFTVNSDTLYNFQFYTDSVSTALVYDDIFLF